MVLVYLTVLVYCLLLARAAFLAVGYSSLKIFKTETFLFYQKLSFVLIIASLVLSFFFSTSFLILNIVNLALLFAFYLQPTPRTTKNISIVFTGLNIAFYVYYFLLK
ncbi:MAG: hypothetical protein ABH810_03300 [bacterium]